MALSWVHAGCPGIKIRRAGMHSAHRYVPSNSRLFTNILRMTYGLWLKKAFNIRISGDLDMKACAPPYILISNHAALLDPFMLNAAIPHPIHWVTSDGNMRNPVMRFLLLKLVGSIPKSKAIPDIETVSWIVDIIRKKKGIVGLFPEGQASWDGRTVASFPSTAKLLKILKAPVVLAKIKGGYLSQPRWSGSRRRGTVDIGFSILFTPEELKDSSPSELFLKMEEALHHDEQEWRGKHDLHFPHLKAAEHLELAFYLCPVCGSVHSMKSRGDVLECTACGLKIRYTDTGEFLPLEGGKQKPVRSQGIPKTPPEWEDWQNIQFPRTVSIRAHKGVHDEILSCDGVRLLQGWRMARMKQIGAGTLNLYADRLELKQGDAGALSFPVNSIEGAGVLKKNLLEFYVANAVYRVVFPDLSQTGRSWVAAINQLKGEGSRGS